MDRKIKIKENEKEQQQILGFTTKNLPANPRHHPFDITTKH